MIFIQQNTVNFPFDEAKILYEENREYMFQEFDFETLYNKTHGNLWAVVGNELIGIIYFGYKNNKWFLSGFSKRKKFKHIVGAINGVCDIHFNRWGITEIYSETEHKHAKFALLRAGFKQISTNIYRKEKING